MPKITFIGAASTVFAGNLLGDIFSHPELTGATISLFDIEAERLRVSERAAQKGAKVVIADVFDERGRRWPRRSTPAPCTCQLIAWMKAPSPRRSRWPPASGRCVLGNRARRDNRAFAGLQPLARSEYWVTQKAD